MEVRRPVNWLFQSVEDCGFDQNHINGVGEKWSDLGFVEGIDMGCDLQEK